MESSNSGRKTVLCAEDDEDQLTARKLVFESAGLQCAVARSGPEALQLFQTNHVDAVVLDYWMPRMKGLVGRARDEAIAAQHTNPGLFRVLLVAR